MKNPHPPGVVPPLDMADVYVYAHGSGAITLVQGDQRFQQSVTLAEAQSTVRDVSLTGARAWVSVDDAALAIDTLTALGELGVPLEPFEADGPPCHWPDGSTPLMAAVAAERFVLVRDLIDRGADVHHANEFGHIALHHAVDVGDERSIDALLNAGADPRATDHEGLRPAVAALRRGDPATAVRLERDGGQDHRRTARSNESPGEPTLRFTGSIVRGVYGDNVLSLALGFIVKVVAVALIIVFVVTQMTTRNLELLPYSLVAIAFLVAVFLHAPSLRRIRFGAVRQLTGTELEIGRIAKRPVSIPLERTSMIAAVGLDRVNTQNLRGPIHFWPLRVWLVHPEGVELTSRELRRARARGPIADELLQAGKRFVFFDIHQQDGAELLAQVVAAVERNGGIVHRSLTDPHHHVRPKTVNDLLPPPAGRHDADDDIGPLRRTGDDETGPVGG